MGHPKGALLPKVMECRLAVFFPLAQPTDTYRTETEGEGNTQWQGKGTMEEVEVEEDWALPPR